MTLSAYGIEVRLPPGMEGRIYVRAPVGHEVCRPVAQFATIPIPEGIGDFGGNTDTNLGPSDLFAVLFEYGPESLGRALFASRGIPTSLTPADFLPYILRPGVGGSLGTQRFFTASQRPFTFYARLGSVQHKNALVQKVNQLLANLTIQPLTPSTTPGAVEGAAPAT
ncbi:MAG: hypothetical protein ACLPVF_12160 [Acidimicrobiales bacterium]